MQVGQERVAGVGRVRVRRMVVEIRQGRDGGVKVL